MCLFMEALEYTVGQTVFYRESGAFVLAKVIEDRSFDGVKEAYLLELTHVLVHVLVLKKKI